MAIGDKIDWRAGTIDPTTLQLIASAGAAQGAMYQNLGESVSKALEKDSEDYIVAAGEAFEEANKIRSRDNFSDSDYKEYEKLRKKGIKFFRKAGEKYNISTDFLGRTELKSEDDIYKFFNFSGGKLPDKPPSEVLAGGRPYNEGWKGINLGSSNQERVSFPIRGSYPSDNDTMDVNKVTEDVSVPIENSFPVAGVGLKYPERSPSTTGNDINAAGIIDILMNSEIAKGITTGEVAQNAADAVIDVYSDVTDLLGKNFPDVADFLSSAGDTLGETGNIAMETISDLGDVGDVVRSGALGDAVRSGANSIISLLTGEDSLTDETLSQINQPSFLGVISTLPGGARIQIPESATFIPDLNMLDDLDSLNEPNPFKNSLYYNPENRSVNFGYPGEDNNPLLDYTFK